MKCCQLLKEKNAFTNFQEMFGSTERTMILARTQHPAPTTVTRRFITSPFGLPQQHTFFSVFVVAVFVVVEY